MAGVASAAYRRISRSKVCLAILVTLAGAVIVLAGKFVFGMHGLLRLADVGGNVKGVAGAVGALGAGAAAAGDGVAPSDPVVRASKALGKYTDEAIRKYYEDAGDIAGIGGHTSDQPTENITPDS